MRTLALAVVIGLLAAAPAHAGWRIDRATAIANVVWHDPCSGQVALIWKPTDQDAADVEHCAVWLDSREPLEWPEFCTIIIHEYGHLARFSDPLNPSDPDHSHSAASVMYGGWGPSKHVVHVVGRRTTVTWTHVDPRCARNGRPYLERHGLLSRRRTRPSSAPDPTRRAADRPAGH